MSGTPNGRPLIAIEDVQPERPRDGRPIPTPEAPLIAVETLDADRPVQPQPDPVEPTATPKDETTSSRGRWLAVLLPASIVCLALVGTVDWILSLLARVPILGLPAAVAATAMIVSIIGLIWRELRALRRLRGIKDVRAAWEGADGERLRRLILRIGADLGETAGARRAADVVDDAGPVAARRIMSRELMAHRDNQAAQVVASGARQGFVMVAASPSPALDAILLIACAARLLRQIAAIYGYRPGMLALRSLALTAGRDAGAVAVADALAQAAAQGASQTLAKVGDAVTTAGSTTAMTGAGAIVGVSMTVIGLGLSLAGRTAGVTGGAVGGGAAAAWRLYRFGLMALVASRPVPFDREELANLTARTRAEVLSLASQQREGRETQ